LLAGDQFCKSLSEDYFENDISPIALDRLTWSLPLYVTGFQVVVFNSQLFPLLSKIDESIAAQDSRFNAMRTTAVQSVQETKKIKPKKPTAAMRQLQSGSADSAPSPCRMA
jgi:hypothetical protein